VESPKTWKSGSTQHDVVVADFSTSIASVQFM